MPAIVDIHRQEHEGTPNLDATDAIYQETKDYFTTTMSYGYAIVAVRGDIDIVAAPILREAFADAIGRAETGVIADLSLVSFIDASGLGVLAGASKRASDLPAGLRLSGVPDRVRRLLRLTGLDTVLRSDLSGQNFPRVPRPARTGASLAAAAVAVPVLATRGAD
jgi:anti-sigma B factor antagonist